MARQTLSEQIWQGLGDAVTDIRQKVVEEPMYGRAVTDSADSPHWPEGQEQEPSFGSSTHTREIAPSEDIDLDR